MIINLSTIKENGRYSATKTLRFFQGLSLGKVAPAGQMIQRSNSVDRNKYEIRNPKQIRISNAQMSETKKREFIFLLTMRTNS